MIPLQMDLLADSRFAVASYGPGAAYAAWLLQGFGAEVRHASSLDPEGLGAFLARQASYAEQPPLASDGAPFITDAPVTPQNLATLREMAATGRVIWITPWGIDNDWAQRQASDLALYAASGWMASVGDPDKQPLGPPGSQCRLTAGLFAAIAALEHAVSGAEPAPGLIDVPVIEALVATLIYDPVSYQYYGLTRARVGNRFNSSQPLLATLACADGHIGLHSPLHTQWTSLAKLLGRPEMLTDARFRTAAERAANIKDLDAEFLLPWLATRTRWQAYHELQAAHIPASAHPDMAEVLASPQLEARHSLETATTPSGTRLTVPGHPARVRAESGPASPAPEGGPWRPGALRVVDLSMGWAGPMVSLNLAAMGADVIKVESHTHFDWWRGSRAPGDNDNLGLHERSHVFNAVNRGKRGITLDLSTSRGRDILIDLASTADVVLENFAAGVIEKLGLTYEVLSARNPSLLMLRQPGFGSDGPESGYVVFGNTIEGMSGLSSLVGYEDGPPSMLSNAFGDPVSGLGGTVAILAAITARARDGKGRVIECAQLEGFLPMVSEGLIEYQRTGEIPRRRGNWRPGHTPSGAYTVGGDRWLVLEVETDTRWNALASRIGAEWANSPALATSAGREANRPMLEEQIAAWVQEAGEDAVLAACAAAGIPAAPVISEGETLGLEPLLVSGFWQGMEREPVGFHLYPSLAYSSSGERPMPKIPAPFLGQHTEEVLSAMGIARAEIAELTVLGVTGKPLERAV
ncbi:MAG: CoA transferase [Dehalococcoidia bacterium]